MTQAALQFVLLCSTCLGASGQAPVSAAEHSGTRPCRLLNNSFDPAKPVKIGDLFRAYETQVQLVRTLHLIGTMRGRGGPTHKAPARPVELGAIIDVSPPNLLRLTGVVPYRGNRAVELTSDGERFGLLIPEDRRNVFLTGPVDSAARSDKAQENLRPRPFLESLRWEPGTAGAQPLLEPTGRSTTRTLVVDVAPTEDTPTKRIDVVFDLEKGVVDSLTSLDRTGAVLLTTHYSDWRTASSGPTPECYARRIVLVEAKQDYQVEFRVLDLALNGPIEKSKFRVTAPRGIPVEHINLFGEKIAE